MVFVFGGETTVNFPKDVNLNNSKGGRNQEMVLAFFKRIMEMSINNQLNTDMDFAFFSLGTDGQDGPTDAAGAFIFSEDIPLHEEIATLLQEVESFWKSKNSYEFWSKFKNGANHVKIGKTGNNLMDVQLLYVLPRA